MRKLIAVLGLAGTLLGACAPSLTGEVPDAEGTARATDSGAPTLIAATPLPTALPQETSPAADYGPNASDFPAGVNPLTGLAVADPTLLDIPAVLVSISNFPPSNRPQAGLSFAPFVYEFSITRGETRFLAVFHGRFPEAQVPVTGDCLVRTGVFAQASEVLGNRVWLDSDADGAQDAEEEGIPGMCVELRDANGKKLGTTTTDSNGIFGFNVDQGQMYSLRFVEPAQLDFTTADAVPDDLDSDVDPQTGATRLIKADSGGLNWDAGMILNRASLSGAPEPQDAPAAEVGPVRSGRLLYGHLGTAYTNSCLIYAFADPTILAKLPHCAFVSHEDSEGGESISIERMRAVAEDNMRHTADRPFSYASNLYEATLAPGGLPATMLSVYFNRLNQSAWFYDPLYRAYLRLVDDPEGAVPGELHADVDRLTGRQLHVENVIIAMVDTEVITRTNLDIHLEGGNTGPAKLFRDGRVFDITWSTRGGEYEKKTGVRRPIQFLNADGTPAPLRPGHTWVVLVTPFSFFETQAIGIHQIRYAPPAGEAQ